MLHYLSLSSVQHVHFACAVPLSPTTRAVQTRERSPTECRTECLMLDTLASRRSLLEREREGRKEESSRRSSTPEGEQIQTLQLILLLLPSRNKTIKEISATHYSTRQRERVRESVISSPFVGGRFSGGRRTYWVFASASAGGPVMLILWRVSLLGW